MIATNSNFNTNTTPLNTNTTNRNRTRNNKSIKNLTWIDGKGWEGVVYSYTLHSNDDCDGWCYVGCTPEESTRRKRWNQPKAPYAGRKVKEAREKYGVDAFDYTVLERIQDTDLAALKIKLEEREKYYIQQMDSYQKGFNSNLGGRGWIEVPEDVRIKMKESHRKHAVSVVATSPDKSITVYLTMLDASEETGVNLSTIHNCIYYGATCRKGYEFKRVA